MNIFYPYPEQFTFNKAREIQTIHTCHAFARHGFNVVLGAAHKKGVTGDSVLEYFRLPSLQNLKFVFLPRYFQFSQDVIVSFQTLFLHRLKDYILKARARGEIDIIYTRHLKVAEFCLKQKFGIPLIFESHEVFSLGQVDSPEKFKRLFEQEKYVYSQIQGLVTISNHLKDYLQGHFPIQCPILRASDGVDLDLFGSLSRANVDKNLLIYTGSLFGWKGVDTIIKAMRYLPDQKLWIFGGSPSEISEKQILANKWKVSDRCLFKGYVTRTGLTEPLAKAFIGVLPNHREEISERFTSPLKLFEYMAAGKVIVASDLPSIREILDDRKAYLCPPASPRSLAETVHSVYRDPKIAESRIAEAKVAAQNYSWDRRAMNIRSFLEEIIVLQGSKKPSSSAVLVH
jgi:glycosyltransferase involved in cell wall biosynthesis